MNIPQIQIRQHNAQIGIQAERGHQEIEQPGQLLICGSVLPSRQLLVLAEAWRLIRIEHGMHWHWAITWRP